VIPDKQIFFEGFESMHQTGLKGLVLKNLEIFIDRSSVEIFVNDGELVITELIFPSVPYNKISFKELNQKFHVSKINSIWNND